MSRQPSARARRPRASPTNNVPLANETPTPDGTEGKSAMRLMGSPRPARSAISGVKVFSATKHADRDALGEKVSEWMANHADYEIVDIVQTQSSDSSFHCLVLSLFYFDRTR